MKPHLLPPAVACLLAVGCRPSLPAATAPGPSPAILTSLDRNEEYKYALRWPEPPDTSTAPRPSPAGAKLYLARAAPGGRSAALFYFLDVFVPPPPVAPDGQPVDTVDVFVTELTRGVTKTVLDQKQTLIGTSRRPGLLVLTQAPVSGGGMRYERAVYALHGGRGYVAGVYAADDRLLDTAPAKEFLGSFELLD